MKRTRKTASAYRRPRDAKQSAARALEETKRRYGIGPCRELKGVTPDPLVTGGWVRKPKTPPTSDRIPGSAAVKDLMHAYKWKRGAEETEATVAEIQRKSRQIGPAYNKGALQYLPAAGGAVPRKRQD